MRRRSWVYWTTVDEWRAENLVHFLRLIAKAQGVPTDDTMDAVECHVGWLRGYAHQQANVLGVTFDALLGKAGALTARIIEAEGEKNRLPGIPPSDVSETAYLPHSDQIDTLIRYGVEKDRAFARKLNEFEQVRRMARDLSSDEDGSPAGLESIPASS